MQTRKGGKRTSPKTRADAANAPFAAQFTCSRQTKQVAKSSTPTHTRSHSLCSFSTLRAKDGNSARTRKTFRAQSHRVRTPLNGVDHVATDFVLTSVVAACLAPLLRFGDDHLPRCCFWCVSSLVVPALILVLTCDQQPARTRYFRTTTTSLKSTTLSMRSRPRYASDGSALNNRDADGHNQRRRRWWWWWW